MPAGGRTTEEQIVRITGFAATARPESCGCANEKDNPWQKQRLS
jgi:hypothetical protein